MPSCRQREDYPLSRKLAQFVSLSDADRLTIDGLRATDEAVPADVDLISEGDVPRFVFLLKQGMAARYRLLADGGRQILTFLLPGDFSHIDVTPRRLDHSIGTIAAARVARIPHRRMTELFARHPRLADALRCSALQEESMLRERIVSLGRRDAHGRVAYLLCELLWRYRSVGLSEAGAIPWALTQTELGDALGLTAVHINRVLKHFRQDRLIATEPGLMRVLDAGSLQTRAGISHSYLQPGGIAAPRALHRDRDSYRAGYRAGGAAAGLAAAAAS